MKYIIIPIFRFITLPILTFIILLLILWEWDFNRENCVYYDFVKDLKFNEIKEYLLYKDNDK